MAITLYKQQKNIFFLHSFINLKNVYNIIIKMIYIHMTFVLIFYVYECVCVWIFLVYEYIYFLNETHTDSWK